MIRLIGEGPDVFTGSLVTIFVMSPARWDTGADCHGRV